MPYWQKLRKNEEEKKNVQRPWKGEDFRDSKGWEARTQWAENGTSSARGARKNNKIGGNKSSPQTFEGATKYERKARKKLAPPGLTRKKKLCENRRTPENAR